jgi:hypothetical protein
MKAAVLHTTNQPLLIEDIPKPSPTPGHVLLRVLACGVCRTDLHIFEGDLPLIHQPLILGHQIVGEVIEGATTELATGTRVGVSWIGGTDGSCPFCRRQEENLCDNPTFTGYSVNGGYAEYAVVRSDFVSPPATRARRHPRRPAPLRRRHRLPQPARSRHPTRRTRRSLWLRSLRLASHRRPSPLELQRLRLHPRPIPPRPGNRRRSHMGRRRKRQAPRPSRSRHHLRPQRSRRPERPL